MDNIKVVTICGSMKYQEKMMEIATKLELENNYCVLQCVYELENVSVNDIDHLARLHRKKIEISDAIFVVNVDGYIGSTTKNEIAYAKSLGKEIIYLEKKD